MKKWRNSSIILELGTRWRRVVNFTLQPLYNRQKSSQYLLDRLGAVQNMSDRCGEEKILDLAGTRTATSW
jgi:hypothetical protein